MTQILTRYQQYEADYKTFSESSALPEWVQSLRESGWRRFQELGLPTARRGNEPWKYTNIAPIADTSLKLAEMPGRITLDKVKAVAPWDDGWTNMVFVDGIYVSDLSSGASSGVAVTSLAEAIASNDDVVKLNLGRAPHMEEDDGFVSLNNAFLRDGAVLHIREGKTAERPVHLLFISTATETSTVSYPRILVVGEANSKATIIESYVGLSDSVYLTNAMTEITLAPGAELSIIGS